MEQVVQFMLITNEPQVKESNLEEKPRLEWVYFVGVKKTNKQLLCEWRQSIED